MTPSIMSSNAPLGFDLGQLQEMLRRASRRPSASVDQQSRFRVNRISKPSSTGNSPRNPTAWRSTMTAGPTRHRSVTRQSYQPNTNPELLSTGNMTFKARPTSWHPSSLPRGPIDSLGTYPPQQVTSTDNFPSGSFTTTQVNGLITPLSQPCFDDPFNMETFSGLDEDPYAYLDEFRGDYTPAWSAYSQLPDAPDLSNDNAIVNIPADAQSSLPLLKPKMATAPSSPDFLPIQGSSLMEYGNDEPSLLSKIDSTANDLVGMGLYDPPSPCTGTLFSGSFGGESIGKGLKLEETFEPSIVDDDGEVGEEDDQDDGKDGEHELVDDSFFF